MTRGKFALAAALIVAAMLATGIAAGLQLAEDAQLPVHWGLDGQPDRATGKWSALLQPAGITALLAVLLYFLPNLEPRGRNLERSRGLYLMAWGTVLAIGAAIQVAVLSAALGWGVPTGRLIFGVLGLGLAAIGNQLGKSRRMFFIGIRTPWTLSSEDVWIRTHRLGGKLMVAGGLLLSAASLMPLGGEVLGLAMVAIVTVATGVPVIYSYFAWRAEKSAGQPRR